MKRGDAFAVPHQNCKKLDAISSSSSWNLSSSSSLGCLVPLAGLMVILGGTRDLDEEAVRGALTGAFLTVGGE